MVGWLEQVAARPPVEIVAGGRRRIDPERDVLAVSVYRQPGREAAAGVRAERRLDDCEDPVGRDLHPVAEPRQVVDDPLDGRDDAAAGGPRPPDSLEQRLGDGEVPFSVGDRRVAERDIGRERAHHAERAEGRVDFRESGIALEVGAGHRPGDDRRQSSRCSFHPLGERQDRPVLDLDLTRLVRLLEDRVRRVGGEAVPGVGGHHLAHQPAAEEQRAERAEAGHHQGECGIAPPLLPGELPRGGRPAAVAQHDVDRVARPHVALDRVGERRADLGHPISRRGRRLRLRSPRGRSSRCPPRTSVPAR